MILGTKCKNLPWSDMEIRARQNIKNSEKIYKGYYRANIYLLIEKLEKGVKYVPN